MQEYAGWPQTPEGYRHIVPEMRERASKQQCQEEQGCEAQTSHGPKTPMQEAVEGVSRSLVLGQQLIRELGSKLQPVLCERPAAPFNTGPLPNPDCPMTAAFVHVASMLDEFNNTVRDMLDRLAL